MALIREFEIMLNLIKTKGEYSGTPYNHPGPAHLSIGQESAAVGMAWTLTVEVGSARQRYCLFETCSGKRQTDA